jgi:hypothetical protein
MQARAVPQYPSRMWRSLSLQNPCNRRKWLGQSLYRSSFINWYINWIYVAIFLFWRYTCISNVTRSVSTHVLFSEVPGFNSSNRDPGCGFVFQNPWTQSQIRPRTVSSSSIHIH